MLHVEQRYPNSFYAPGRWTTADGCMPFRVCWAYFSAIRSGSALDALNTARGIGLAFADKKDGRDAAADALAEAFPRAE